jgi:alpha-N-acetylglucosamine transferase
MQVMSSLLPKIHQEFQNKADTDYASFINTLRNKIDQHIKSTKVRKLFKSESELKTYQQYFLPYFFFELVDAKIISGVIPEYLF